MPRLPGARSPATCSPTSPTCRSKPRQVWRRKSASANPVSGVSAGPWVTNTSRHSNTISRTTSATGPGWSVIVCKNSANSMVKMPLAWRAASNRKSGRWCGSTNTAAHRPGKWSASAWPGGARCLSQGFRPNAASPSAWLIYCSTCATVCRWSMAAPGISARCCSATRPTAPWWCSKPAVIPAMP
ncbi:hypothetical protein D3C79_865080 [compost metagenome]